MAELKIDGRTKVKTLKADFKKAFGATLRVYTTTSCNIFADDADSLASLMKKAGKTGTAEAQTFGGMQQVGNFEKKLAEVYGIGVQVANSDNSKLSDNSITLVAAGKE